ncbi:MAG: mechanosensitive ion channel family protein [Sulfurimonas sp.]|nr:mechanosensitive ion channel family protein [Sulfurimonas sp.]
MNENLLFLSFTNTELWFRLSILVANLVLLLLSKYIVSLFKTKSENEFQLTLFRVLNLLFLFFHILDFILVMFQKNYEYIFSHIALTLVTIYVSVLFFNAFSYFSRRKFGIKKTYDDNVTYIDTYSSRLVDIISVVLVSIISLYIILDIWNFDSLLKTSGIFGIIIAFLALTNQIWAPDMFYGMVILNSKMLEDGDVVQFSDDGDEYIISRVTFIYTILLDVRNNHRTLIKNSKLLESKVDNLSKKASTDGLRIKLSYKIGYPKKCDFDKFKKDVNSMFDDVNQISIEREEIKINDKVPFEWYLNETGDYALCYDLYFYLESLPSTKVTRTVRSFLLKTPNLINEEVYNASLKYDIDLSTPLLHQQY